MSRSALYPPNVQSLSDDVIGSVTQRITRSENIEMVNFVLESSPGNRSLSTPEINASVATIEDERAPTEKKRKRDKSPRNDWRRQINQDQYVAKINSISIRKNADLPSLVDLLCISEAMQRKKHRENQRKYRQRQAAFMVVLVDDVHQLHKEIKELNHRRYSIKGTLGMNRDVWSIAVAYYACFSFGLQLSTQDVSKQLEFVRCAMSPDVAFNGGFGPDELLKSWSVFQWFSDVEVNLMRLVKQSEHCVVMITRADGTITERTLCNLFPHLWEGERKYYSVRTNLATKLLDQRIVMDGRTVFRWDSVTNSMASVNSDNDMLTPIFHLLGNLKDVSLVFDQGLVSPDFQWKYSP
ncbi:hypothetical protein F443_13084 [Phytophthora nicotianae P1569]|uniref:Uncharacterized protein n=4 Tax=Phytophthora nicotianae TaxID=4792 RepID=V9EUE4_PHYNI|nr:hypothetical protein F443_13084 [Phytophthora nicotianae P1569]